MRGGGEGRGQGRGEERREGKGRRKDGGVRGTGGRGGEEEWEADPWICMRRLGFGGGGRRRDGGKERWEEIGVEGRREEEGAVVPTTYMPLKAGSMIN